MGAAPSKGKATGAVLLTSVLGALGYAAYYHYLDIRRRSEQLFLGLDLSTQSLKAVVIDSSLNVVHESHVSFHETLDVLYGCSGGVTHTGLVATAPTRMFVQALDIVLEKLAADTSLDISRIVGVSGSAQQHGSVYWSSGAEESLSSADPRQELLSQLRKAFLIEDAPIWMDSSTEKECRELEQAMGGAMEMAQATGSRGYERFTGNQILKLMKQRDFDECERISLLSSFLSSLLLGKYAPIECSDASGMNLMDIHSCSWSSRALSAIERIVDVRSGRLSGLLGEICSSSSILGNISPYMSTRYGFSPECKIIACSGDNPCALAGMAVHRPGDVVVSLGTSTTLLAVAANPSPGLEGHVLRNPVDPATYMIMLCYKNGDTTRKLVCDRMARSDWTRFSEMLAETPAGNSGSLGFYYSEPEITPTVNGTGIVRFNEHGKVVNAFNAAMEVRAVVENQILSLRSHAEKLGVAVNRVLVTGGAAVNPGIVQVIANVFNCTVYESTYGGAGNGAALGAAYRAAHGLWSMTSIKTKLGGALSFGDVVSDGFSVLAFPDDGALAYDTALLERFARLETEAGRIVLQ